MIFKVIHGIAPTYLSDRIVMNFDVNGYDTRGSDMDLYLPTLRKDAYRNSFMCMGGKLWNDLPEFVQKSTNIEPFKHNYRMYKRITSSWQNRHSSFLAISQFLYEVNNDNFLTTWKFHSVHGYGLSYFIRHGVKLHFMLHMCHYITWFVFIYRKLSICFTLILTEWFYNFFFILSFILPLHAVGITDCVLCWF